MALNFLNNGTFTGKLNVETTGISNTAIFENSGQSFSYTAIKVSEALGNRANLTFVVGDNLAATDLIGEIGCLITSDGGALEGAMSFKTNSGDTLTERMVISSEGALRFNAYGAGTLITDASGNITVSSGGGTGGPYLPLAGGTLTGNLTGTTIGLTGSITADHFRTNADNTGYNLLTRNSAGSALYVQAVQSNTNQQIAKFSYGSATAGVGNTVLQVAKDESYFVNCNVGIGTTSPDANLDILNGTTGASLKLSATATAYWQLQRNPTTGNLNISDDALGNVMSFDQLTGNVGIGTDSPDANLDVEDITPRIRLTSSVTSSADEATVGAIDFYTSDASSHGQAVNAKIEGFADDLYGRMGLRFFTGGIGAPTEKMRISNNGALKFNTYGAGTLVSDASGNITVSSGGGAGGPFLPLAGGTLSGNLTVSIPDTGGSPPTTAIMALLGYEGRGAGIKIRDNVNNATSPSNREWFVGTGYSTGNFNIGYAADGSQSSYAANTKFLVTTAGDVGIGTTIPGAKLDIVDSSLATMFRLSNTTLNSNTKYGSIVGRHYTNSSQNVTGMLITSGSSSARGNKISIGGGISNGNAANNILFYTAANSTTLNGTQRMVIDQDGNVGIGATNPTFKLDIGSTLNSNTVFRINGLYSRVLLSGNVNAPTDGVGMWNFINHAGTNALTRFYVQDANNVDARLTFRFTGNGGSTEILSGSSTGNVGIGTTSPSAKLDVSVASGNAWMNLINGSETAFRLTTYNNGTLSGSSAYAFKHGLYYNSTENAAVTFYRGGSSTGGFLTFTTNNGSEKMRIDSAGNVGIGTTNPESKLHIVSGSKINTWTPSSGTTAVFESSSSSRAFVSIVGANQSELLFGDAASQFVSRIRHDHSLNTLQLWNGGSQRLTVTSAGKVGIGTTTVTDNQLKVIGGSDYQTLNIGESQLNNTIKRSGLTATHYTVAEQDISMMSVFSSSTSTAISIGGSAGTLNAAMEIRFYTASNTTTTTGTQRMVIRSSGNVGIGTNAPATQLTLGTGSTGISFQSSVTTLNSGKIAVIKPVELGNGNGELVFETYKGGSGGGERMRIDNDGKVGINETNPFYQLDVDGTIRATGDVIAYSDARVKENVVTIDNALDKVTRLRGVTYTRKDIENKETKMGVIAQEVLEVVPEVVHKDDDGMYAVAYGNMNGLLIEAIKELKAEIEELKSRL